MTTDNKITSIVSYKGNLRTEGQHIQSGNNIITDAPVDNQGKGEAFSPTDLVATALASCMLTIMGIKSADMDVDLTTAHANVTKTMSVNPRRIAQIRVEITLPAVLDKHQRKVLEAAAHTCPVAHSLHPDTKQVISFLYA